jgi:pyruvate dehydrogenase E2 component (dihydrolipoamide acetyltransferase)
MVSASPLAKKVAERMAVDLDKVTGTGPRGKIYKADVIVTAREPEAVKSDDEPAVDEAGRPSQLVPFNSMRQAIASRMSSSKFTAPHLYFFTDVNMDKVIAFKNELSAGLPGDVRISINDIFIKLTALALKEFPNLNATVEKDAIRLWDQINIGLAVALEDGLIVPAIPEADELRFPEIANYRKELIDKARHGKLSPEEMSRGTFTISSLAKSGITHFTAIINPPQTAILSIGPAQEKAIVEDGELRTGRMATFGLSVDHRVIDGKVAADFLSRLKDLLENAKHRLMLYY